MSERLVIGASPRRRLPIRRAVAVLVTLAIVAIALIRLVFFELVRVRGDTMAPAAADGALLLVASLADPERGDVVLIEAGGRAVLRRVIGLPGERIGAEDGVLLIDGAPLTTHETGLYAGRGARPIEQRQAIETLPDGRAHTILGDHDGAARPWRLDVPEMEVGPGQLFVICDNRRTCPLDELAGVVPADEVAGVVLGAVGEGGRYGWLRSIASSAEAGSGVETTASPRK